MKDVAKQHQLKIARATLKMNDAGANIMGGMTKNEARRFLYKHGKYSFPPPPVYTGNWNEGAWIRYIDRDGKWL